MARRATVLLLEMLVVCLWFAGVVASAAQAAQARMAAQPVLVIDDSAEMPIEPILDAAGPLPFTVAARVASDREERLAALVATNIQLWLVVTVPAQVSDIEPWRRSVQSLLEQFGAHVATLEIDVADQPVDLAAFAVRLASTEARALTTSSVRVALGGERMRTATTRADLYTRDLAPYVDVLSVPSANADEAATWLAAVDSSAHVAGVLAAPSQEGLLGRQVVSTVLRLAGGSIDAILLPASAEVARALKTLASTPMVLSRSVAPMDDPGSALQLTANGSNVADRLAHRLLFDDRTFATYLALPDGTASPVDVAVRLTIDAQPVIYDLVSGERTTAEAVSWDAATRLVRLRVPPSKGPLLINFNRDTTNVVGDRNIVVGQRGLSIAEIIARHQAVQRRQDARVQSYIANADTSQHFRPTVADPGYDVVTENRYFVSGDEIEWEELSFSVNGAHWGADRPAFPLLQAEKVLSLPLQLRFDNGYRYRLDGEARVNGYDCYVVRFEPVRSDAALYKGTVWIDRQTFARIRVQALQGGLPAPVVSNDETQDYAPPVMVGNQPVFLLHELLARQIMLIAGRNLLVEKLVRFHDVRVNDLEFATAREAARSGDRIMFRETNAGLRYYMKEGGQRVVSEHPTQSAKAMAMGVYIDPSYAFPLPILGINYLNFAFGGPDSQLALLFGGVLAAGNIQRPKLGKTPFDASIDFFGIAVPSSDRLYTAAGENKGERALTWPMSTGVNVGWQYTPFQKLTGQYQFRFDAYVHDTTTAEGFALPSSTMTNGLGLAWEYRRAGFTLALTDTQFRRATWRPWGTGVDASSAVVADGQRYARHTVSLSRDFYVTLFQKIHLNGAFFGGRDLDRFAKYQFGMFDDTRIHGVPASGVRYGQLGMARAAYSFNIFDIYRLDLFAEQAWGRDRPGPWEPITGLGVAVNLRAPKSTILRADFGKSVLPTRFQSVGSYTLQLLVLKPLR